MQLQSKPLQSKSTNQKEKITQKQIMNKSILLPKPASEECTDRKKHVV